jgi:hypothetical protein
MLLAILTYCYALGIYSSRSIERRICRDDTLRYLCAWKFANRKLLRRFRDQNRRVIERCLLEVCLALREPGWEAAERVEGTAADATASGRSRCLDSVWKTQVAREVRQRLLRAELEDSSPLPETELSEVR